MQSLEGKIQIRNLTKMYKLYEKPSDRLRDSLVSVYEQTRKQKEPDLVILTGGPSRMKFFQELCRGQFSSSRIVISDRPEYDISRGLVFVGSVDDHMTACIRDIETYTESGVMQEKIECAVPELVRSISQPLSDSILTYCVKPAFSAWRSKDLATLNDFEKDAKQRVVSFMRSTTMQSAIQEQVEPWSEEIIHNIEMDICEISRSHHVNFTLNHGALIIQPDGPDQGGLKIDFVNTIRTVVSVVLIVIMGMICGGAGTALVAVGPVGIVVGALIGVLAVIIGKGPAMNLMMGMNMPGVVRRMINVDSIISVENRKKINASICRGMLEDQGMIHGGPGERMHRIRDHRGGGRYGTRHDRLREKAGK